MTRAILFLLLTGLAPALLAAQNQGEALAFQCLICHGPQGQGGGEIPPLRAKSAATLMAALQGFKSGERKATIMDRIAKGFSDEELRLITDYLAKLP